MTLHITNEKTDVRFKSSFAIVYFTEKGFEVFASDILDEKLLNTLTLYPTLLGMLQNQNPSGLATSKINENKYLFAYVISLSNPTAIDKRLLHNTVTVINFIVNKDVYKEIIVNFDEFEKFTASYFEQLKEMEDLYAVDFNNFIQYFFENMDESSFSASSSNQQRNKNKKLKSTNIGVSLATEFNNWLNSIDFSKLNED